MSVPALEPLDTKDAPVVTDFKQTWTTTPFTTFGYWATSLQGSYAIPGGNCFNFAIAFNATSSITGGRLMCHKDHGNISFKSKTEDRYYTVDSGVNTPVKYPVPTKKTELAFSVVDGGPVAIKKPDPLVVNPDTMYNVTYDAVGRKWGTDHYIKNQKGFKIMVETSQADALKLAQVNALGQNATVFLARMLPDGNPGWGLSVFMYFKRGSGNDKGTMIIKLPKTSTDLEEVIKLNVQTATQTEIDNAKTKLANRVVADRITVQWTVQTANCFDFLLGKLKVA